MGWHGVVASNGRECGILGLGRAELHKAGELRSRQRASALSGQPSTHGGRAEAVGRTVSRTRRLRSSTGDQANVNSMTHAITLIHSSLEALCVFGGQVMMSRFALALAVGLTMATIASAFVVLSS